MTRFSQIATLNQIARDAGATIMAFYRQDPDVFHKQDKSPVTEADIAADKQIVAALHQLSPEIPVVSEEGSKDRQGSATFWLVDPLDGTKSFIKHTDEFTVNIGLIEQGKPVLGVVYVPARDTLYYTADAETACRQAGAGAVEVVTVRQPPESGLDVVASTSHRTQETNDFIDRLPEMTGKPVHGLVAAASSLKLCLVAEGAADVYPRLGPTMEWDTAAAHAVLLAAGGRLEQPDGGPFVYGKEDGLNTHFVAWGEV